MNIISSTATSTTYKIIKQGKKMDLVEILLHQFEENMCTIRSSRKNTCKFGSLIMCIFFYFKEYFPSIGKVTWDTSTPITIQIGEFIESLGKIFDNIMHEYFKIIKEVLQARTRLPK